MQNMKIRKSRTVLKQTLLALMKKKPYTKITVKELCEKADLNRSTFYANYAGIQELLLDIYTDILDEMSPALIAARHHFRAGTEESRIASVTEIISYLQDNLDIFQPLLLNNEDNLFEKHLSEYYLKKYALQHADFRKQYVLVYHMIGSFTLVHQWISDQCPCAPRELAQLICKQSDGITQLNDIFNPQ